MDAWVSREDLTQLIERCIDVKQIQWAVFHGLSNNAFNRLDISDARELVGLRSQGRFRARKPVAQGVCI